MIVLKVLSILVQIVHPAIVLLIRVMMDPQGMGNVSVSSLNLCHCDLLFLKEPNNPVGLIVGIVTGIFLLVVLSLFFF